MIFWAHFQIYSKNQHLVKKYEELCKWFVENYKYLGFSMVELANKECNQNIEDFLKNIQSSFVSNYANQAAQKLFDEFTAVNQQPAAEDCFDLLSLKDSQSGELFCSRTEWTTLALTPPPKFASVDETSGENEIGGQIKFNGLPMKLEDLSLNSDIFSINIMYALPKIEKGIKYIIIDSDKWNRGYDDRKDIEVVYQDVQDDTSSCGDNALLNARKAKELGLKACIYVANGHAVTLIVYEENLDYQTILQKINTRELQ